MKRKIPVKVENGAKIKFDIDTLFIRHSSAVTK